MAGSQSDSTTGVFSDPILAARVEAIKQLAGGLSDRVAVMDRTLNVVYANETAWTTRHELPVHQAKCYEAFARQSDPCGTCPAVKVFDAPEVQSVSCAAEGNGTACGMHQAFPLIGQDGRVASVLVLFKPSRDAARHPDAGESSRADQAASRERLGGILGRSAPMRQLFEMVRLVADSQATVLIHGESGTGKELVAKTIHRLSDRREKPFVVVDCGSLPETLLESELFGHMKGAFTGATVQKRGLFEEADGGTIFLDEIADTTATFQAKLLRALQEGEIKRVGGTQPIKIDVRVISATNKDLCELVKARTFRQDLYYRLAVLPIHLPPLRERKDDIPLLVRQFVADSCARHRQPTRQVSEEVLHALSEADWPGNVRELQHYIERAVVTTTGEWLTCADKLPTRGSPSADSDLRSVGRSAAKEAERARIIQALGQTSGNRVRAAKLLKISRASLYLKLREYQIKETD
ncbi:sigma-54 interaction domain-containing protein [Nitrospira moscoviensis]|jgi:two-component system, NtrC family, response regulator HydG|uniref:Sensory sigma-54 dependent transcriptional regulator n=1 Tax=Nitrospira moscoviensis TaxID=42253 RepID=A0A0K2GHD5_NITMO|nr:sigma-54 dependent transcriptional regulator [Nitrospira moscoviensis]ALA60373.1 Sensory sigma-54 dependent transcriptional regulator [Nitrospira moscoviensis]